MTQHDEGSDFWIIIDPVARDESKIVSGNSKRDALLNASREWGYEDESEEQRGVIEECLITRLCSRQATDLGLKEKVNDSTQ
jgi:hypothetical protein